MTTTRNQEAEHGNRPVRSETFKRIWAIAFVSVIALALMILGLMGEWSKLATAAGFLLLMFTGAQIYHKRPEWSAAAILFVLLAIGWDLAAKYVLEINSRLISTALFRPDNLLLLAIIFLGDYLVRKYLKRRRLRS